MHIKKQKLYFTIRELLLLSETRQDTIQELPFLKKYKYHKIDSYKYDDIYYLIKYYMSKAIDNILKDDWIADEFKEMWIGQLFIANRTNIIDFNGRYDKIK